MSEREGYEQGVPSWVDHTSADPGAARGFYGELLGWETEDMMPAEVPGHYFMARVRGLNVAGIGSPPPESEAPPAWTMYVSVDDADEIAWRVGTAGGTLLAGPFDVFDAGRQAVFSDSGGAVFSVWQPRGTIGAQLVNEPGAFTWSELNSRDPEASKTFYDSVFGWKASPFPEADVPYTIWHLGNEESPSPANAIGGMMEMTDGMFPPDTPPHWTIYFAVDDVDQAIARTTELGGSVLAGPIQSPGGMIAVLTDPVGAVFAVVQVPEGM